MITGRSQSCVRGDCYVKVISHPNSNVVWSAAGVCATVVVMLPRKGSA